MSGSQLRGGDSSIYYLGTYARNGNNIRAEVTTDAHTKVPGMQNVFGVDRVHITLQGEVRGDAIVFDGSAREAPGVPFQAILTRLAD